jgi:hypothetical protein
MIADALPAAGIIRYRALVTIASHRPIPGLRRVRAELDRPAGRLTTSSASPAAAPGRTGIS